MSAKKKKAQQKILHELKSQLMTKAKKLGIEYDFTGINFDAMKIEAAKKILGDLLAEKSNLEYELYMKGVLDKESTIKLEKIKSYITKAQRIVDKYQKAIEKELAKKTPKKKEVKEALKKRKTTPRISISR